MPLEGGHTGSMSPEPGQTRPRPSASPFRDLPAPTGVLFQVDSRVTHDSYGLGRVVQLNNPHRMNVKFSGGIIDIDSRSPRVHLL